MNTRILYVLAPIAAFILLTAGTMSNNGIAGYTGSSGESKCTTCHNSYTINTGGGTVVLSSTNMSNWKYDPSTVYHMKVKVAKTGVHLFGFAVEALNSSNTNCGTFTITDATHTKKQTASNSRINVVHQLNGGSGQDSVFFSFDWTSPSSLSVGNVTFYFIGNASNALNNMAGDYIYSSTQVITPNITTGIDEALVTSGFSVYPNPSEGEINVSMNLHNSEKTTIDLYDLTGRLAEHLYEGESGTGEFIRTFDVTDHPHGIYLMRVANGSDVHVRKIVIQ
jgi:hypothetical protein